MCSPIHSRRNERCARFAILPILVATLGNGVPPQLRLLRHFIDHENVLTISNVILPMVHCEQLANGGSDQLVYPRGRTCYTGIYSSSQS